MRCFVQLWHTPDDDATERLVGDRLFRIFGFLAGPSDEAAGLDSAGVEECGITGRYTPQGAALLAVARLVRSVRTGRLRTAVLTAVIGTVGAAVTARHFLPYRSRQVAEES